MCREEIDYDLDIDFKMFAKYESKKKSDNCRYEEQENPIKNWLKYRISNDNYDCDNSLGMAELYKVIWGCCTEKSEAVRGDTINSFWTTFKVAMQIYDTNYHIYKVSVGKKPFSVQFEEILNDLKNIYDKLDQNMQIELEKLARLTHSIGNFIPMIRGYNTGRYPHTKDYFDLTLDTLKVFLSENGFKDVVERYQLDDYVKNSYDVKRLFEGHSFENPLPGSGLELLNKDTNEIAKEQLKSCIKIMNCNIEKRQNRILDHKDIDDIFGKLNKVYNNKFKASDIIIFEEVKVDGNRLYLQYTDKKLYLSYMIAIHQKEKKFLKVNKQYKFWYYDDCGVSWIVGWKHLKAIR